MSLISISNLLAAAAILLLIAVIIGWSVVLAPMDGDSGPAPLTAVLEGGRV